MLKKLLCLFLFSLLVLTGCSSEKEVEGKMGEQTKIGDLLSYEIYSLDTVNKIESSQPGSGIFYKVQDQSKVFLDLVLTVTNNSSKELDTTSLFEGTNYIINENEFDVAIYTETNSMSEIDAYGVIPPQETTFIHITTEVDEKSLPEDVTLNLQINKNKTKITLNREALKPQITKINKGEKLVKENNYEVTYVESFLTKKLEPSQPKDFYTYYKVDGDNTYAVAKYKIKNINSSDIDVDDILATKVFVDKKYEYTGLNVVESDGDFSSYESIKPMTELYVYSLIEIPDNMVDKSIEFKLATAGETRNFELSEK